jgi:hypothetical protein
MTNMITVMTPGGIFAIQCPGKPRIFTDGFAESQETAYDDLVAVNGVLYHTQEVIALAKKGDKGFGIILWRSASSQEQRTRRIRMAQDKPQ